MKERKKEGRKRKRKRGRKGEERGRKIYFPDLKGWNEADLGVILHSPTSCQDLSNHLSSFFFSKQLPERSGKGLHEGSPKGGHR